MKAACTITVLTIALTVLGCTRDPSSDSYSSYNDPPPNPYATYYKSNPEFPAVQKPGDFEDPQSRCSVYRYSSNRALDDQEMYENGYALIGWSAFNGASGSNSEELIKKEANDVGASAVLVNSSYTGTISGSLTHVVRNPPKVIVSNSNGAANAYGSAGWASGNYHGTTSTIVSGGTTTYNEPYSIQRYDFLTTYWVKQQKFILGARFIDLPQEFRSLLQRNSGVMVTSVVKGTPAFFSNLLVGDVILKIHGHDVVDARDFKNWLSIYSGEEETLDIVRGGISKDLKVRLNPE